MSRWRSAWWRRAETRGQGPAARGCVARVAVTPEVARIRRLPRDELRENGRGLRDLLRIHQGLGLVERDANSHLAASALPRQSAHQSGPDWASKQAAQSRTRRDQMRPRRASGSEAIGDFVVMPCPNNRLKRSNTSFISYACHRRPNRRNRAKSTTLGRKPPEPALYGLRGNAGFDNSHSRDEGAVPSRSLGFAKLVGMRVRTSGERERRAQILEV
jgi:hypothetical protein